AEELLEDGAGRRRAGLAVLDERRDGQIPLEGDHPRVRTVPVAVLRRAGLGSDRRAGYVAEERSAAVTDDAAHESTKRLRLRLLQRSLRSRIIRLVTLDTVRY